MIREKLKQLHPEDDSIEDEEDVEEDRTNAGYAPWGKSKKAYYNADNVEYEVNEMKELSINLCVSKNDPKKFYCCFGLAYVTLPI